MTIAAPFQLVTEAAHFAELLRDVSRQDRIALDSESNGFHRYPERVCLLQVATVNAVYIIDPLALEDVSPLGEVLADDRIEKVLHGADYDVRSLDRQWGFRFRNLHDTGIAARFVGMERLGLGAVMLETLERTIDKDKELQRADWSLRPLKPRALDYAAGDVLHLLELRQVLGERLEALGRTGWVAEECARQAEVRYSTPDREMAFLSIKGAGVLDGRGLAILRALHHFREEQAIKQGRPPFRIITDQALLYLAAHPTEELAKVPGLGEYGVRRYGQGLRRALREGLDAEPVQRAWAPRDIPSAEETARLKLLKAWRTKEGERLGLDPSVLWPAASLERLSRAPDPLDAEVASPEVRHWQRRHMAPLLRAFVSAGLTPAPDAPTTPAV